MRIHPPMRGMWVQSLVWEDSTCLRASKPVLHNKRSPHNERPAHHHSRVDPALPNSRKPALCSKDPAQPNKIKPVQKLAPSAGTRVRPRRHERENAIMYAWS